MQEDGTREWLVPPERLDQGRVLCEVIEKWGYAPEVIPEPRDGLTIEWHEPMHDGLCTVVLEVGRYAWCYESGRGRARQGACTTAREAMKILRGFLPQATA